jgi:hypothetical protein
VNGGISGIGGGSSAAGLKWLGVTDSNGGSVCEW